VADFAGQDWRTALDYRDADTSRHLRRAMARPAFWLGNFLLSQNERNRRQELQSIRKPLAK
jgi:hypothetical protein